MDFVPRIMPLFKLTFVYHLWIGYIVILVRAYVSDDSKYNWCYFGMSWKRIGMLLMRSKPLIS